MNCTCEYGKPETWPDTETFLAQWAKRFDAAPMPCRTSVRIIHQVEMERLASGERVLPADELRDALNWWLMFFRFAGPLYPRFKIEFDDRPSGAFMTVEKRNLQYLPPEEHEIRVNGAPRERFTIPARWEETTVKPQS